MSIVTPLCYTHAVIARGVSQPILNLSIIFWLAAAGGAHQVLAAEEHFDPRTRLTPTDLERVNEPFRHAETFLFGPNYAEVPTGTAFWPSSALKALQTIGQGNKDAQAWLNQQWAAAKSASTRPSHPLFSLRGPNAAVAVKDFESIIRFGLEARFNANAQSVKKAEEYLVAWANTYEPTGDPIDEEPMVGFVMGYELVRDGVSKDARRTIDLFLRKLYNKQISFASEGIRIDNKVSRHLLTVGSIAFLIGGEAQKRYVDTMFQIQLDYNFYPDGSSYDYHLRDSVGCHVATVQALYQLAWIAENNGLHWFQRQGVSGRSFNKELDFVIPYATGVKKHLEFAKSYIPSDKGRTAEFNPKVGRRLLTLAIGLDNKYRSYATIGALDFSAIVLYLTLPNPILT